jgi:hypothetical protein
LFAFKSSDITKLARIFGVPASRKGATFRFELPGREPARRVSLEIFSDIPIGTKRGNLISVYTPSTHLQLHFCSGYVVSEMLGEVTFVGESNGRLCGLIIEKEGGCSLYANVDRSLLSGDFTQLGPEVMLSGIALSLTDGILDEAPVPVQRKRSRGVRKTGRRE